MRAGVSKRDYYEVLGVDRQATEQQIKSAYRKLALKHHPDRNPGDAAAEEQFKEAAEAYAILADAEKRGLYDRFGHAGVSGAGAGAGFDPTIFADFSDIFWGPRRRLRVRRHLRRPAAARRPTTRIGSSLRPRDHVRRIGHRNRHHHSDSSRRNLRDLHWLRCIAGHVARDVLAVPRFRPAPVSAGLPHRRTPVPELPRHRERRSRSRVSRAGARDESAASGKSRSRSRQGSPPDSG